MSYAEITFNCFVTSAELLPVSEFGLIDTLIRAGRRIYDTVTGLFVDPISGVVNFGQAGFNQVTNSILGGLEGIANIGTFPQEVVDRFFAATESLRAGLVTAFSPVETFDQTRQAVDELYENATPEQIEDGLNRMPTTVSLLESYYRLLLLESLGRSASNINYSFPRQATNILILLLFRLDTELENAAFVNTVLHEEIQGFKDSLIRAIPGEQTFTLLTEKPEANENVISFIFNRRASLDELEQFFDRNVVADPMLLNERQEYIY